MFLRCLLLTLFCAISLFSYSQKKARLVNSGELLNSGIEMYNEGKYKEALSEFEKVPPGDTNYVWALYEAALVCLADSQITKGIGYCEKAFAYPSGQFRHPELLSQYASLLDHAGQQERALKVFDSAIAVYPAFINLRINKGTTLIRMKRYAQAETVFQEAVVINPYSSSAHFKMGVAAWGQGKIIPSFLSLIGGLIMEPEGRFAQDAINLLNEIAKSSDDVTKAVNERKEGPADNFLMIEQIVLSKIALDNNYKIRIKLDDAISRQIQVVFEKLSYDEADKDFYMQYYTPVYKSVFEGDKFEHFINYIFSIAQIPAIQEFNKKKEKEIESLKSELVSYFDLIRSTRELQFTKRASIIDRYQFDDGVLFAKGVIDGKDKMTGNWDFIFSAGNRKGQGSYNEKGEKHGNFTFYYFNGQLRGKEFYQNGKQEGEETYYFDNGVVSSKGHYRNGLAEGQHTSYFIEGAIKSVQHYSNGKLNGVSKNFLFSGILQSEENYKEDLKHGLARAYYLDGSLKTEGTYEEDQLTGSLKSWNKDASIAFEANYNKNNIDGVLKRYDENGKLSSVENYKNGALDGEYVSYYDNGQVHYRYMNVNGVSTGEIQYFDRDGKLYSILDYDKEKILSGKYFDKSGKQISFSETKQGKLELEVFNPDGTKKFISPYSNGTLEGIKRYFYGSGKEQMKETYVNGELNGETVAYFPSGKITYSFSYKDQQKNGYYTNGYSHGGLREEGWYANDQPQGECLVYDEPGNLLSSIWYLNGSLNGPRTEYWQNGNKKNEYFYDMDKFLFMTEFDTTGKVINVVKLDKGNGKFKTVYPNGKRFSECNYVNGNIEGDYKIYFPDGTLNSQRFYKNGLQDSSAIVYEPGGAIQTEYQYKMGEKSGTWKYYHDNGRLYSTEEYVAGSLHGKSSYYSDEGKLDTEIEFRNGERHGMYKKYAPDGTLMFQIRYEDGMQMGYSYLDNNGQLIAEIPFVQGTGKIKAFYPNGNLSATMEYIDGVLNGEYLLYYPNGKLFSSSRQLCGNSDGDRLEYFSDGKLKGRHSYLHDNLHGPFKEYNAAGILIKEGNYYNSELHGEQRFYDVKGALKQVRKYYYGLLLEVK